MLRTPSAWFILSLLGTAGVACSAVGADGSATTASDVSETDAASLDDAIATTLLAGGCEVTVGGKTTTTPGTGGKCPKTLSAILDTLEAAGAGGHSNYVVSEGGDMPDKASYRFVISGDGPLTSKLFVATVGAGGGSLPDDGEGVESIGFSPSLGAFVFWRIENGHWIRKGDGAMVKPHAENVAPAFECVRCHATGAPLMKELHDSWGNWTSTWFSVLPPAKMDPLFSRLMKSVTLADKLEQKIIGGMHLHSAGRVARAQKDAQLSGVLTQLMCEVGEPSLVGAHTHTSQRIGAVGTTSTMMPGAIIANQLLVPPQTGGTGTELGLEQSLNLGAKSISQLGSAFQGPLDATAYNAAIQKNGQTIGGTAGDTLFPMSSPEKSYADLDAVQELLRKNLIDQDIVADILMTDPTVSSFSDVRCKLAKTLPATWTSADDLRAQWSKALAGSSLRGAAGLAARLADTSDLPKHGTTLEAFGAACVARSAADKTAFTEDMLKIVSQRRVEFAAQYPNVIESDMLIPKDTLGSRAHAIRLNATTCAIEDAAQPFVGEK